MCLFSMPAMPASPPMPRHRRLRPRRRSHRPRPTPPSKPRATMRAVARPDLQGYRSTIATSGLGLSAQPQAVTTALKTLLGQ